MPIWIWGGFLAFVLGLLALDLGVFHRRPHAIGFREAMAWTGVWIAVALAFSIVVYLLYEHQWLGIESSLGGRTATLEYLSGYLIEKSLSLDNIFVIALVFAHFRVPAAFQHRVLFWGILGALVFRGIMIAAGLAVLARFEWTIYIFGGLLLFTSGKMLLSRDKPTHEPNEGRIARLLWRVFPITKHFDGPHFTTRVDGKRMLTPLAVVLVIIELSDLMFAVDSIPAVFAVTREPFIVFTSNVFAILGLRALYFALAGLLDRFHYLKLSLVFILAFVGVKMMLIHHFHIPTAISLAVILGLISIGLIASLLSPRRPVPGLEGAGEDAPDEPPGPEPKPEPEGGDSR